MKRKYWLWGAVALLGVTLGINAGMNRWQPEPAQVEAPAQLFAQNFPTLYSERQEMNIYQGKPLVVNFWATWCSPCVEEMPDLEALQHELKDQNKQIIGLGIDTAEKMREFAETHKITYPLYVVGATGIEISRLFGNQSGGLPYTVLIDAEGVTRKTYIGRLDMEELRRDIAAL